MEVAAGLHRASSVCWKSLQKLEWFVLIAVKSKVYNVSLLLIAYSLITAQFHCHSSCGVSSGK